MTDLEAELVQAQIELERARKAFEKSPSRKKNIDRMEKAKEKVAEAKLAFESRQGKIFDSREEEVLHSNRWKYEM
jgi:CHASE3 domain sensor protein